MARAVAVNILKGGFGKSTVSINLARELAERNGRALLVDLDDNGHTTFNLGCHDQFRSKTNHVKRVLQEGDSPVEFVQEIAGGMDLLPSHTAIKDVEDSLKTSMGSSQRLRNNVVEPLLDDVYDFIVVDTPANRGLMNQNSMFATRNLIMPMRPESGWESGINQTTRHVIQEANEYFNLDLLALVPTDLSDRLDQDRRDRQLLEAINSRDDLVDFIPEFARVSEEDWTAINEGEYDTDLPGIRTRSSIDDAHRAQIPLRDYDPDCDQLHRFGELAQIVENGGVER